MYIDWGNKTIHILKTDMLQIQTSPTSIYELDIDLFRSELNDLSDDAEGIHYDTTHQHVAPVSVGGVQLARVIEIINGYTVTFEDGQYAVNLTGANSNIGDRVNVNQVSVRSANSAGLPNLDVLETSAFRGSVTLDQVGGRAGTQYPMGTSRFPVDNIPDAREIAISHGLNTIHVVGDVNLTSSDDISDLILIGQSPIQSTANLADGCTVDRSEFCEFTMNGAIDGDVVIEKCHINDVKYSQGIIKDSLLMGTVQLGVSGQINFLNCASGNTGSVLPVIDINGVDNLGDCSLIFRNYSGGLKITEKTGPGEVSLDVSSGKLVIDSTCVNGTVLARGDAKVVDHNGDLMPAGTYNGGLVLTNETYFITQVKSAFAHHIHVDTSSSYTGTNFPMGTPDRPVNNVLDALAIGRLHGIHQITFEGDLTIAAGEDVSEFDLIGEHASTSNLTLTDGCVTSNTIVSNCKVSGYMGGRMIFREAYIYGDLVRFEGLMEKVTINGKISLANTVEPSQILECYGASVSTDGSTAIEMDFGLGFSVLLIRDWIGPIKMTNNTSGSIVDMSSIGSRVFLESTCTTGSINIQNVGGFLTDTSTGTIVNASSTDSSIADKVWDSTLINHQIGGSTGEALNSSGGGTTPSAIADAVWDETLSAHNVSGSTGEALNSSGGGTTPSQIADAVWNSDVSTHTTAGSFGEKVGKKLLTLAQWIGLR